MHTFLYYVAMNVQNQMASRSAWVYQMELKWVKITHKLPLPHPWGDSMDFYFPSIGELTCTFTDSDTSQLTTIQIM